MAARIYIVTNAMTGVDRLVEANTAAQAIGFVTRDLFSAKAAKPTDVARLMKLDVKVEDATAAAGTPSVVIE